MLKFEEITNKQIWENFLEKNSPQSLFQSWNWGETVKKYQISNIKSQILWRLGIYDSDHLVGIAQIVKTVARRGTFLHIRHGPILSVWSNKYLIFVFNYLKEKAKSEKALFIRISPLIENSNKNMSLLKVHGFHDSPIHQLDGEICWVIDLNKSEEELLSNMRKTTRYLIKQAKKLPITIVKSKNANDIDKFLDLYDKTASRHHFVKHEHIKEEFKEFLEDDGVLLFNGYYQDRLLSAALIIFYNNQAIYHHSASIEQKIPVNYLLQWEVILEAKKKGMKIYNMWGVATENKPRHPWKGLSLFKKGFGGHQVEYLHTQDLPLSPFYCATYIIEWFRKIRKGY